MPYLKISYRKALLPILLTSIALIAAACGSGGDSGTTVGSPSVQVTDTSTPVLEVVTTIYPVTYFAERIGEDRVEVRRLVPPGVEAHDFEPTSNDIIDLRNADVFVYTDPSFEVWVEDALENAASDELIVVKSANIPAGEDVGDPHVWLNPVEAVEQVRAIQSALSSADPAGTEWYRANADALAAELRQLDDEYSQALASCALDTMIVSHEAYGHMAEQYGLKQAGLAGLSPEFETTPGRIADIIEQIELLGVGHILQEPIVSDALAETVADETGAEILPLHPLESLTPAEAEVGDDYFSVMRRNLDSLKIALNCG